MIKPPMRVRQLENSFGTAFRNSSVVFILLLAASLCLFVSPPLVLAPIVTGVLLWIISRHPTSVLGVALAFMPLDFMAIAVGKFYGLPHMTLVSVCDKELILILLAFLLWRRNGFTPSAPDWFLLACLSLTILQTAFAGTLTSLALDIAFIIPYAVGRVTVLSEKQESLWGRRAVWIVSVLSILGMIEVFILGEGPRTLLYAAIDSEIEGGQLTTPFHGAGFIGLREAATMVGPPSFAVLCMIAMIIWWVYFRNPLPAGMIGAGLVCSVTRGAWLSTAIAIVLLAVIMGQLRKLSIYVGVALVLFLLSVPFLGLSDYLQYTKTGQDDSAKGHVEAIPLALEYDVEHPFGSGNTKISALNAKQDSHAVYFETTYLVFAAAYGLAPALCFVGFLYSSLRMLWRKQSKLAHAALGILVGMCLVMTYTIPLIDRRLVVWAFFPIGLALRSVQAKVPEGMVE
jgi:O-antigen ligase/polysaccharide polymerase Wzy-like membrane protein